MFISVETYDGFYKVGFKDYEIFSWQNTIGCSYNVIPSRLLNMSYSNYLRWLRDKGATLAGRMGYSYAKFKDKKSCEEVCKILNKEWQKIEDYL